MPFASWTVAGGLILARFELMPICWLVFMGVSVSRLFVFDFWCVSSNFHTIISSNSNNRTVAGMPAAMLDQESTSEMKGTPSKAMRCQGLVFSHSTTSDQHPRATSTRKKLSAVWKALLFRVFCYMGPNLILTYIPYLMEIVQQFYKVIGAETGPENINNSFKSSS